MMNYEKKAKSRAPVNNYYSQSCHDESTRTHSIGIDLHSENRNGIVDGLTIVIIDKKPMSFQIETKIETARLSDYVRIEREWVHAIHAIV